MNTQLDERQELLRKVEQLSPMDIQKVRVFIAGVEAGKAAMAEEHKATQSKCHFFVMTFPPS